MSDWGVHLFETTLGRCGLAWGPRGITGAALPEADEAGLLRHLHRWSPGAAVTDSLPPNVAGARDDIIALLAGEPRPLDQAVLDMAGIGEFEARVYAVARTILPGQVLTYGAVAERLGDRNLARAVGGALGRNPFVIIVPCHRVMAAQGGTGGFSAPGGVATKLRLLEIEGASLPAAPVRRKRKAPVDMPRLPFL